MKIHFLLPNSGEIPIGGIMVAYEYANRLVKRGHEVTLYHTPDMSAPFHWRFAHFLTRLIHLKGTYQPSGWFQISPEVKLKWIPFYHFLFISSADVIISTYWQTTEKASVFPQSKGNLYYLVQDYELYRSASPLLKEQMQQTFRGKQHNLPISPACETMILESGGRVFAMQPNGIDLTLFRLRNPVNALSRNAIGFPFRPELFKGTRDAIAALIEIHREFPHIPIWAFGSTKSPDLPNWVHYHFRPDFETLVTLYNQSMIFVTASHFEGWGLPGLESMACGAALVSTNHGGIAAYAEDGVNALLSPIQNPHQLTLQIRKLILDSSFRFSLVENALKCISNFDWERSVEKLLENISKV
ncbi:MAG: glycosyltransferase family 4 protein [Chloroherpetonaceae bacterium]|nr:glycosyltransferase family 4 protein [Chloroherpetonaceae bacterium]